MNTRLRLLILGRPKAGKTGLLAELLKAGFRVGVLDFDNNPDPIYVYAHGHTADRLSVVTLRDKTGDDGSGRVGVRDEPTALLRAFRAIDDWGKVDPEHPWGPVAKWGPDTVLVADSLTGMGDACFNRTLFLNNRKLGSVRDADWGDAMRQEDAWLARLMGPEFACHMLVTAHVKLIGPRVERIDKNDDTDLVTAKTAISVAQAELLPTRYYPSALGRALPQEITRRVPAACLVDVDDQGKRWIRLRAPHDMPIDIGVPGLDGKEKLAHPGGILEILEAVTGRRTPA